MKNYFLLFASMLLTIFGQTQNADFSASSTTICVGGSVTFTNLSTGSLNNNWTFVDGGSGQNSTLVNPTITYNTAGTFDVILTVTNGGSGDTEVKPGFIKVIAAATSTLTSAVGTDNQTVCANDPIIDITYTIEGATGATFSGLSGSVLGVFVPNTDGGNITISGTPTATGTSTYSFTTTGANCAPITVTGTITVDPPPTLVLTSGNANPTICLNQAMTGITYTFGGSATGATVTGLLTTGLMANVVGNTVNISGTPSASGSFPYVVTTTGGSCPPEVLTGTITVTPEHVLTLTSAAATTNQTLCAADPITDITYSVSGSATGATVSGLPPGVSGTYSLGVFTIAGTSSSTGTFTYTVTTAGGSCTPVTQTGTLTLSPPPTLTLSSAASTANQTICVNNAITNITYNIGGSATGATVTGLPTGLMGVFAGSTMTISGTPTVTGTFNYTVATTGGVCPPEILMGTITIATDHTLTLTSAAATSNQTVCLNDPIADITYSVGGSATGASVTGLPAGVTGTYSLGVFTISGTFSTAGTFSYTVTTSGGSCTPVTQTGTIIISVPPTLNLTSAISTINQIVCVNTPMADVTVIIGGSATGATVVGLPTGVLGTFSGSTMTISGTPSITGAFNYTISTTGGPCIPATFSGVLNVDPNINLISAPGTDNQTACADSNIIDIVYSLGAGLTGASVTGLPAGVSGTFAPGSFTISGVINTAGVYNYTVSTTGGTCGPASATGTITVTGGPSLDLLTLGNEFQTLCEVDSIQDITYQVGGTATGATAIGLPAGVTGTFASGIFTISGLATATGVFPYSVTTTGSPCGDSTLTGIITIDETHQIQLVSAAASDTQQVCENSVMDSLVYTFSGGATGATVLGLPSGMGAVISNDSIVITGAPDVPGTYSFTIHTTGGTCPADSAFAMMTVDDPTTATLISAVGTNAQIICVGESIDSIIYFLSAGVDSAVVTNLGSDFTSVQVNDSVIITGSSSTIGIINYTLIAYGTFCPNDTVVGSIEVQNSAITLSSGSGSNDQTVGVGQSITDITYIVGGPVTVADLPPGVTSTYLPGAPSTLTISGTPTTVGSYYYTVLFNGPCGNSIVVGDLTVMQDSLPVITPIDSTVIFIPNLFTPNGDGHNDVFVIPSLSLYPNADVKIINREGVIVYTNADYDNSWDGTFEGEPLPDATYYYVLYLASEDRTLKGPITILRNEK